MSLRARIYGARLKNWSEIEKLDRALQCQPKRYKECSKYISQALIPLYLAEDREVSKEQKSRIEDYLKPFYKYPEKSCEILFNVLDKLICYNQSSIAVNLCKKPYTQIAQLDEFFINPKDEIAEVIVWDELQDAYVKFKKNMDVDWVSYDKRFKDYEFQFTQDDFKSFEEVMKGHLDLTQMFKTFKNKIPWVLFQIKLLFAAKCMIWMERLSLLPIILLRRLSIFFRQYQAEKSARCRPF
jgi:hypothetical protein